MHPTFSAIVLLIGLPAVALAQSRAPAPEPFATLPPIGFSLPPIGLPLPPLGLPPLFDTQPRIGDGQPSRRPEDQQPRFGSRRSGRSTPTAIFFVPTYGWGYDRPGQMVTPAAGQMVTPTATVRAASSSDRQPGAATGRLRLDVKADRELLQLYVDGFYVGTPDDVNGELELEPGAHRIEIRATGYETLNFDVKIVADRSITYQGALKATSVKSASDSTVRPDTPDVTPPPATSATPTTIYFIPGCYLGNVPPEDVALPVGCDLSRLIVHKPNN